MGNIESSSGIFFGSIIGGMVLGPVMQKPSLIGFSMAGGVGFGTVSAIYYKAKKKKGEDKDFFVGVGYGLMGILCATATPLYTWVDVDKILSRNQLEGFK